MNTQDYIQKYARARPIFLSVLRGKEAALYQKLLPLNGPILDVGCGDGFFARITFGTKRIDVGLDMPDSRINEARTQNIYKKIVTYDGVHIPFQARSFQTVMTNSVLEHVDHLSRVIKEMYRILKPGGICIATVMAAPWERYLLGTKLMGPWYRGWMKKKQVHKNLLTATEWEGAFANAGFTKQSVTSYLGPHAGALLDGLHYVSIPSLVSYTLFSRWVLVPAFTGWYPYKYFAACMDERVPKDQGGALLFVLRKP